MINHLIHKIAVVRHDDRTSFEITQILLQHVQRDDIQVVRRLVEHKKVRATHQDRAKIQTAFLSPTQLVNVVMLFLRSKKEIVQEL